MKLRLRELREERGLTQAQVAEAVGIKRTAYNNYEQMYREPSIAILVSLADLYSVSIDEIVGYRLNQVAYKIS